MRQTTSGARGKAGVKATGGRRWSKRVTETSDALDLEKDVFRQGSARRVALSVKRSAERSHRRKASPFNSAMSMLTFYVNRAGKNLSAARKRVLMQAKDELRKAFHRDPKTAGAKPRAGTRARSASGKRTARSAHARG